MAGNKKAQVAVFVVVALVVIGAIITIFIFRERTVKEEISPELAQVFEQYQGCLKQETKNALEIAGMQGGRIDEGEYIPGSDYAPFSSHLNFMGVPVKYWYSVSANGVIREQIPTLKEIEREIENYVKENLDNCDFENFYKRGISIEKNEPDVNVGIQDNKVVVTVNNEITAKKEQESAKKNSYNLEVESKIGKFYGIAKKIYGKEKQDAFLEQYAVDVLYNYAPVDGVEIQCGPKIWSTKEVIGNLKEGLEQNLRTIKFNGKYYDLKNKNREYFVVDSDVDEAVNVIYSKDWPTKIEIRGNNVDDDIMMAEAVGMQEGMGIMGFCYVPYHYVYDIRIPVLIQIYSNEELFEFPIVLIVDSNMPRVALPNANANAEEEFDLCAFKNQEVEVDLFDVNLKKVNGNISFECFDQQCRLGETKDGKFRGFAPACVNGYLNVRADGYAEEKQIFSTNSEKVAEVILEREYKLGVSLTVDSREFNGNAIISFTRDDGKTTTAALPEMKNIGLSEGSYEVKVYVYGNSSVIIPATTKYQCVDVPREGILGFFGAKKEKCFDITIPATKIENALTGGGKVSTYILESELEKGKLKVEVDSLPTPNSLDKLAQNFELFETKKPRLNFYGR